MQARLSISNGLTLQGRIQDFRKRVYMHKGVWGCGGVGVGGGGGGCFADFISIFLNIP